MVARALSACFALLAIAGFAFAQDAIIFVDVANPNNRTHANLMTTKPFEDLLADLQSAKSDALLLYTDFASRAGTDLKIFLRNITGLAERVIRRLEAEAYNDSDDCWEKLEHQIKKVEHDARRSAVYSGDNHHKFLLGHMIVFRMHLNKSEDYLKRCDKVSRECGFACEDTPRVKRWRRLALDEIHRVRDDMNYTRRTYRDIVSHARRKLNHIRKHAISKSRDIVEQFKNCINKK